MYELRPIVSSDTPIELPKCMYRLKNIHAFTENELLKNSPSSNQNSGTFDQVEQFLKNIESKKMADLEIRQKRLLDQLEELRKIIQSIKCNLQCSKTSSDTSTSCKKSSSKPITVKLEIPDIVINVNPLHPPYFLLFLQRLLKGRISLNISSHVHSSISQLPSNCESLVSSFESFQANGIPSINIRLIWKKVGPVAEMNVSHYPIQGEGNILRFLARTLSNELSYENCSNLQQIDSLLDLSYVLLNSSSKSFRNNKIQSLNKSMGKSEWLGGQNKITIADIAMHDCLKKITSVKELSGNLSKWFKQCEQYVK